MIGGVQKSFKEYNGEAKTEIFSFAGSDAVTSSVYSLNGITWIKTKQYPHSSGFVIRFGNNKFLSSGQGRIMGYSDNGKEFIGNTNTSPFSTVAYDFVYAKGIYVAVGWGSNTIAWSNDGIIWTGLGNTIFNSYGNGIFFDGTKFWALGEGSAHTLAYSIDGKIWTGLGKTIFTTAGYHGCYTNGTYVLMGKGANSIAYSTVLNPLLASDFTGLGTTIFSTQGKAVLYSNLSNKFIAGGSGTNTIAHSTNGIDWTGLGTTTFGTICNCIVESKTRIVASGSGTNTIAHSTNGIDWTGLGTTVFSSAGRTGCVGEKKSLIIDPCWRFLGDSITNAQAATQYYLGWTSLLCYAKHIYQWNIAVPGYGTIDIINISLPLLPNKTIGDKYVFCAIGVNDLRGGLNVDTFMSRMLTILNSLISKGYDNTNIIIPTLYYITNFNSGSLELANSYNNAIKAFWTTHNLLIQPDVWTYMENNGGASLLHPDGVHPITGHSIIATYYGTLLP